MPRMSQFMMDIRRGVLAAWFGILLMLLQSLAAAEHLSAMAAAAAGAPLDGPLGFLGLCTASGLTPVSQSDTPNSPQAPMSYSCALCAMDCTVGSAVLPDVFVFPVPPHFDENVPALGETTHIASFLWRHIFARGPPETSFV
ncbi:MAG: hypothetical protein P8Y67_12280 [Alphaproteobacteria bacterium]